MPSGNRYVEALFSAKGDLIIGAGSAAESALTVGADGTILTPDAAEATGLKWVTVIRSVSIGAQAMWPSATGGGDPHTWVEMATNKQYFCVLPFDPVTDEYAQCQFIMPDSYNGGVVTAKFVWGANSNSLNSVVWGIQGICYGDGELWDVAWGVAQIVTDAHSAVEYTNKITAATGNITFGGTSPAGGELCLLRVYRDADNPADDLAVDALLVGVIIEYTTDSVTD